MDIKYKIVSISEQDAYYDVREYLIGQTVLIPNEDIDMKRYRGTAKCTPKIFISSENSYIEFPYFADISIEKI